MAIGNMAFNVRRRVDAASQTSRELWLTYRDTQRQAITIAIDSGRSVANTEIGAAKNIYSSARAAFDRARADGMREIARHPSRYVPAGRKQTVAAYHATLDLLNKAGDELSEVATSGYRRMSEQLSDTPVPSPSENKRESTASGDETESVTASSEARPASRKSASRRAGATTHATHPKTRKNKASGSAETDS